MSETEKKNRRPEESSKLPYISLAALVLLIGGLLYVGYEYVADNAADVDELLNTPLDTTGRELQPIPANGELVQVPTATETPATTANEQVTDEVSGGSTGEVATATPRPVLDEASDRKPEKAPEAKKPEPKKETPKLTEAAPDLGGVEITHTVQAGETFYGISNRYNLKKTSLKAINPQVEEEAVKSGVTKIKIRVQAVHTVGPGDILRVVAAKYGISVAQLMAANKKTKNSAERGEKLIVPFPEKK